MSQPENRIGVREAAEQVLREYDLWAEDANDGEFALWSSDRLMAAFMRLREALREA